LDRFAREFKKSPGKGTAKLVAKGLTAMTVPTVAFEVWNRTVDEEGYDSLTNRTKDNYYVIATGNEKEPFIKIPKSREIAVLFSSLFQRTYRVMRGEEGAFKDFSTYVGTNFAPQNPLESNIFSPLIGTFYSNKDFANRDIVPSYMENWDKELQKDEQTSYLSKKIGEVANLSPIQIDYILKSYTGVVAQILIPLTSEKGGTGKAITSQFTANPLYSNQGTQDFYENLKNSKRVAESRNARENLPSKAVTPEEKTKNYLQKQADVMAKLRKVSKLGIEPDERISKDINLIAKEANQVYREIKRKE
jgi:hypothetical protein